MAQESSYDESTLNITKNVSNICDSPKSQFRTFIREGYQRRVQDFPFKSYITMTERASYEKEENNDNFIGKVNDSRKIKPSGELGIDTLTIKNFFKVIKNPQSSSEAFAGGKNSPEQNRKRNWDSSSEDESFKRNTTKPQKKIKRLSPKEKKNVDIKKIFDQLKQSHKNQKDGRVKEGSKCIESPESNKSEIVNNVHANQRDVFRKCQSLDTSSRNKTESQINSMPLTENEYKAAESKVENGKITFNEFIERVLKNMQRKSEMQSASVTNQSENSKAGQNTSNCKNIKTCEHPDENSVLGILKSLKQNKIKHEENLRVREILGSSTQTFSSRKSLEFNDGKPLDSLIRSIGDNSCRRKSAREKNKASTLDRSKTLRNSLMKEKSVIRLTNMPATANTKKTISGVLDLFKRATADNETPFGFSETAQTCTVNDLAEKQVDTQSFVTFLQLGFTESSTINCSAKSSVPTNVSFGSQIPSFSKILKENKVPHSSEATKTEKRSNIYENSGPCNEFQNSESDSDKSLDFAVYLSPVDHNTRENSIQEKQPHSHSQIFYNDVTKNPKKLCIALSSNDLKCDSKYTFNSSQATNELTLLPHFASKKCIFPKNSFINLSKNNHENERKNIFDSSQAHTNELKSLPDFCSDRLSLSNKSFINLSKIDQEYEMKNTVNSSQAQIKKSSISPDFDKGILDLPKKALNFISKHDPEYGVSNMLKSSQDYTNDSTLLPDFGSYRLNLFKINENIPSNSPKILPKEKAFIMPNAMLLKEVSNGEQSKNMLDGGNINHELEIQEQNTNNENSIISDLSEKIPLRLVPNNSNIRKIDETSAKDKKLPVPNDKCDSLLDDDEVKTILTENYEKVKRRKALEVRKNGSQFDNFIEKLTQRMSKGTENVDQRTSKGLSKYHLKRYKKGKLRIYRLKKLKKIHESIQAEKENLNIDQLFEKLTQDFVGPSKPLARSKSASSVSTTSSYITDDTRSETLSTGSKELPVPEQKLRRGLNEISKDKSLYCEEEQMNYRECDKDEIKMKIQNIFLRVYDDLTNGRKAFLELRRQNIENCVVENGRLQFKPNDQLAKSVISSTVQRSKAKFKLILYILKKIQNLLETDTKLTKRELYYQLKSLIGDQRVTDRAINSISCLLDVGMWELNIVAQKGLVFGNLKILLASGETLNCNVPGTMIPQDISEIIEIQSTAYFILVVEKESIFHKLIEEDLPNKLTRPFIMITGKGFPDLNTQLFLRRLWVVMSIPIFILVDADPHGISIMLNYKFGSVNNAHVSHHLAVPKAKWLGVFPSEIGHLNMASQPLTERELKLTEDLLKTPYMADNPKITDELNVLKEKKCKAGIEGLIKSNVFLSEVYLPTKFFTRNFI